MSIPLSSMSRPTISGARDCVPYFPSEETGQSIMNMDTNEITINHIVGFPWNDGGTDVEDELPTPAVSPSQIVVPAIPPAGTEDPESARLLGRTPEYWLEHMGRERTIQAALRLHHDASLIMTNIQVMSQLATSFSRAASEVMRTVHDREPFPTDAVDLVTPGRRVRRAAHYMAAMGLWRPTNAPVFPGPVSASSCNSCMACDDCFPDGGK